METSVSMLLSEKLKLLSEILDLTKSFKPYNDHNDATNYIQIIAMREEFLNKVKAVDKQISSIDKNAVAASPLQTQIKTITSEIISANAKLSEDIVPVYNDLRKNIKELNTAKNVNNMYQKYNAYGASMYDSKR